MTTHVWEKQPRNWWKILAGGLLASALTYSCRAKIEPLEMKVRAELGVQMPSELNRDAVDRFLYIWSAIPEKSREKMLDDYVHKGKDSEELRKALREYRR